MVKKGVEKHARENGIPPDDDRADGRTPQEALRQRSTGLQFRRVIVSKSELDHSPTGSFTLTSNAHDLNGRTSKPRHRPQYADPIINHWFHLLSAVDLDRRTRVSRHGRDSGLKKAVAKEQIKPITDAFYQHYKKVAGILLVVLLFTGGINFHYVNQVITSQTGSGIQHHAKYLTVFFIKLFLVLCLLTLFLYTVLFKVR